MAPAAPARNRVLVVEDDAALRTLLAEALAQDGIEAATAADPAEALALFAHGGPYSLVLLDWRLGGATGRDFAAALRRLPGPRPPIVLVTADGNELERVAEIGAQGFLKKPFSLDALIETVQRFAPPAPRVPPPTTKAGGDRLRREGRLRWMAAEVGRIRDEFRFHRAALDDLMVAGRRGPLPAEERARRRDLATAVRSLRLRLAELQAELEAVGSGAGR